MTDEVSPESGIGIPNLRALAQSGIYFLLAEGEVVYVGQSVDMRRRVADHIGDGLKVFDAVSFVPCHPDKLISVEAKFIRRYAPKYNLCGVARMAKLAPKQQPPRRVRHRKNWQKPIAA